MLQAFGQKRDRLANSWRRTTPFAHSRHAPEMHACPRQPPQCKENNLRNEIDAAPQHGAFQHDPDIRSAAGAIGGRRGCAGKHSWSRSVPRAGEGAGQPDGGTV